jgi:hypothetical protein
VIIIKFEFLFFYDRYIKKKDKNYNNYDNKIDSNNTEDEINYNEDNDGNTRFIDDLSKTMIGKR